VTNAFDLTDRVALVIETGYGLDRSFAYTLARQGETVICGDIDILALDETVRTVVGRGQLAHAVEVDVTDECESRFAVPSIHFPGSTRLFSYRDVPAFLKAFPGCSPTRK
jgi:NAD(P)-dependent dehydrogenase (short-subunit alcohol dehydrogenase family)